MQYTRIVGNAKLLLFVVVVSLWIFDVNGANVVIERVSYCPGRGRMLSFEFVPKAKLNNGTQLVDVTYRNKNILLHNNTKVNVEVQFARNGEDFKRVVKVEDTTGICQMLIKYGEGVNERAQKALGIKTGGRCPIPKGTYQVKNYPLEVDAVRSPPIVPSGRGKLILEVIEKETNKDVVCIVGVGRLTN